MTTKYTKPDLSPASGNALFRANIPENFELPPCGIEDVDRAIFKLFDEQLPLFYEHKGNTERIPVIFATGERAFVLRRNKPLTDRHGALILPLVSILRSGLSQEKTAGGFGVGPGTGRQEIMRRKHADSIELFKEINAEGLQNQENVVNSVKHVGPSVRDYRRNVSSPVVLNDFKSPVTEIITMSNPRYFSATYEITLWAQYLQQMNGIIEAIITNYTNGPSKSFRLESDKGYWFVGYTDPAFNGDLNFDSMTDAERIVKYNFSISVNGYIINPEFPGSQTTVRRTLSAPKISFDTNLSNSSQQTIVATVSGNPSHHQNQDLEHVDDPLPGSSVGGVKIPSAGVTGRASSGPGSTGKFVGGSGGTAGSSSQNVEGATGLSGTNSATIGGTSSSVVNPKPGSPTSLGGVEFTRVERFVDPFTGEVTFRKVLVKTKTSRHGEKVHDLITLKS